MAEQEATTLGGQALTAEERFAPLLKRAARSGSFASDAASEWIEELRELQWLQIREIFFVTFLLDPPRATLTKAYLKRLFDRADEDHNGDLDREEVARLVERAHVEAFRAQLDLLVSLARRFAPRAAELSDEDLETELREGYKEALAGRRRRGATRKLVDRFWTALDADSDGTISRREFVTGFVRAFQGALGARTDADEWDRDMWKPGTEADKLAYFRRSAAAGGPPDAMFALALLAAGEDGVPMLHDGTRLPRDRAAEMEHDALARAASLGHHAASYRLALMYAEGRAPAAAVEGRMEREDGVHAATVAEYADSEAARLFAGEAAAGDTRAAYQLGVLHVRAGRFPEALDALERSAERTLRKQNLAERVARGEHDALFTLGVRKMLGTAFAAPNTPAAVDLISQAATGGHGDAMYVMALLHYIGFGTLVAKDERRARDLWQLAGKRGHEKAYRRYERLKERDQEAKSKGRAAETPGGEAAPADAAAGAPPRSCTTCATGECALM